MNGLYLIELMGSRRDPSIDDLILFAADNEYIQFVQFVTRCLINCKAHFYS